uniref:BTAD domain-containing putative transcriptional regulator n=1 Tax=Bradyrhizobium sp. KBS0725 TaxID=2578113 RepID=UPI001FEE106C|nr:BTAD domain-containing putative transcriptional regulator [Bradyrhizobium sp. KBS0725]
MAYLACTAPQPQSREKLSALLWGSHFDAQARQNLRQALFRLRRVLGQDALHGDGEFVSLNEAAILCDVGRFEALVREGSRDALSAAADLYRGRFIDDVSVGEEGWTEWLSGERERLQELALGAMVRLGEYELAAGRAEHALKAGQRAIALNNMREDAHRLIVQALADAGRKAEALKHYQDVVARLKLELNTEPDAATTSLVAELRSKPPPSRSPAVEIAKPTPEQPAPAVRSAGSERRQLTIMACNIVDSMALSVHLDPEDLRDLLTTFHWVIDDVVPRFDGFVAQYLSDGALVYFGYPVAHEHDAEQAVRAGVAILDAVGRLKAASGVTLQARAGVATGVVVVGEQLETDDMPRRGRRVAIGETPDLAARLQAVAPPGELVISAATRRLLGRMFDCRALAAIEVNGLPQPVEVWQVHGETAGVSRFEARRSGVLAPLVGRQEEIDLLLRRWHQARDGEGRVVLLSGEPGIGKSRVAETLLVRLESEPHARLRYFCSPHHTHSALYPFIARLERAASFEPGSDVGARLDRLQALLKPVAKNLPRDVALIAELLGVPPDERFPAVAVSPQQKREMILTALFEQLDSAAAQGPVLIVVEDAHWIDPTSQDLLDRMIERAARLPVLLVVTARPEFQPGWIGQPHVTMLPLSRLGRLDSAGIMGGVAEGRSLPDEVVEQVLARADGVPLFIEELTSALLESGVLRETTDCYVLDGTLPTLAMPLTLQASLVARLDRVVSARDTAQIGAAIGREFSHELIGAVSTLRATDLNAALERLMASGLVARRGTPPDAIYAFKHALVQDAAYVTMLKSRRRELHASIAEALVGRFSATVERLPEVVAHHFTEAGLASEAVGYWRKAGQLATARSAGREAVTFFEQALHLLRTLPESQSALEQGFDIRLELRPVLLELGRGPRILECLGEAEALAERLNDDRRRARVYGFMTVAHSLRGELSEALAAGTHALEAAERLQDLRLRIVTTSLLIQVHQARGEYDRVIELATGNLAALPADWVHETFGLGGPPSVWDRGCLIMSLAELGRFTEAARYEAEAMSIAEPTEHAFTISMALFAASTLHLLRGDWAEALSRMERWIALARTGTFLFHLPWGIASSAWPLAQLGEASEVLNRLTESEPMLERLAAGRILANIASFYCSLARACLLLGRCDEARRLGNRALELCPSQPGFAAHALLLLGDVAARPDQFDAALSETHYREALAIAEGLGMRPIMAHCHFGLGKVYLRTGKPDQARDHLAVATTMYRDMEMRYWLAQVEAETSRPQ